MLQFEAWVHEIKFEKGRREPLQGTPAELNESDSVIAASASTIVANECAVELNLLSWLPEGITARAQIFWDNLGRKQSISRKSTVKV